MSLRASVLKALASFSAANASLIEGEAPSAVVPVCLVSTQPVRRSPYRSFDSVGSGFPIQLGFIPWPSAASGQDPKLNVIEISFHHSRWCFDMLRISVAIFLTSTQLHEHGRRERLAVPDPSRRGSASMVNALCRPKVYVLGSAMLQLLP